MLPLDLQYCGFLILGKKNSHFIFVFRDPVIDEVLFLLNFEFDSGNLPAFHHFDVLHGFTLAILYGLNQGL